MVSPPQRSSFAAQRRRLSIAVSELGARLRDEGRNVAIGARRAGGCFAFASGWVGAWLIGVWSFGSFIVYADEGPTLAALAEPGVNASGLREPTQREAVARGGPAATAESGLPASPPTTRPNEEIERVVGVDGEPMLPRVITPYPLDDRSRVSGRVPACPSVELTEHAGDAIAFDPPARVTPPFRERLRELDRVLREVSLPFYGRAPSAVLVASSYDCRSINGNARRLSEHALGNAIDITGFRFAADDPASAPGFELRVDRHWNARGDATRELHARFLQALTQALIARDVFRTLLGPAHRDHADHFHFDMAPHYYVDL